MNQNIYIWDKRWDSVAKRQPLYRERWKANPAQWGPILDIHVAEAPEGGPPLSPLSQRIAEHRSTVQPSFIEPTIRVGFILKNTTDEVILLIKDLYENLSNKFHFMVCDVDSNNQSYGGVLTRFGEQHIESLVDSSNIIIYYGLTDGMRYSAGKPVKNILLYNNKISLESVQDGFDGLVALRQDLLVQHDRCVFIDGVVEWSNYLININGLDLILKENIPSELPPDKGPSLITKIWNLTKATVKHSASGFQRAPENIVQERIDICLSCDRLNKQDNSCNECGCYVGIKTSWSSEVCPLKKWLEYHRPIDPNAPVIPIGDCGCNK